MICFWATVGKGLSSFETKSLQRKQRLWVLDASIKDHTVTYVWADDCYKPQKDWATNNKDPLVWEISRCYDSSLQVVMVTIQRLVCLPIVPDNFELLQGCWQCGVSSLSKMQRRLVRIKIMCMLCSWRSLHARRSSRTYSTAKALHKWLFPGGSKLVACFNIRVEALKNRGNGEQKWLVMAATFSDSFENCLKPPHQGSFIGRVTPSSFLNIRRIPCPDWLKLKKTSWFLSWR